MDARNSRQTGSRRRRVSVEELETRSLLATYDPLALALAIPPPTALPGDGTFLGASLNAAPTPGFTMAQTLSDQAQATTLAFDGLAIMTGDLDAQSFFPPGKVADYTGFQFLRDNDPDNMGHNTSFLTRVANNVISILDDAQFARLTSLAVAQFAQIDQYGYQRFPLMEAFRRLVDGDVPAGSSGLDLAAVKQASADLYQIDGQISFDRALLYANIINSFTPTQRAYLDAMKGKGFNSWPNITDAQIASRMRGLPQGTAVAVMTYAGDLFSWYAGSIEADGYFCPERQGTYYGGFYIKDAPAVGHEGYSISEQLTATAGAALCDSSEGYVTPSQAALMSSLVDTQRDNLYAGTTNIVGIRTQIATLLRGLLTSTASSDSVKAQVLALSRTYGELDGENNYNYATVFARVYASLSSEQKSKLAGLRTSIMSGTYADGTPFDYSVCTTPFLYSAPITDRSVIAPYIGNTDYLFLAAPASPTLSSNTVPENRPSGTAIGTLSMTGAASGSPYTYSLVDGAGGANNGLFQISGDSLETRVSLDHEAKDSDSIRVRATDRYGNTSESIFIISVTDVNEAPVVNPGTFTVAEGSPAGTIVGMVSSTDPDANQARTWDIVGGNDGDAFSIDPATGRITVASPAALRYSAHPSFSLAVRATDDGSPALSGTAVVTINLTEVKLGPTEIHVSGSSIAENRPVGTVIGRLSAVDTLASRRFTYRLVPGPGGDDNSCFAIVGQFLTARKRFDYETRNRYSVRVRVTDQRGLSFEQVFAIRVLDVNESPVVAGLSRTVGIDTPLAFQPGDFSAAFHDPDGNALVAVRISSAPARGKLLLGGATVTTGKVVPLAELGKLVYVPPKGYRGSARFTWSGSDGRLFSRAPGTVALTVS
ncbi:MAG: cadherin domain-containing protein [Isosphaeraceae bacterium]